ncbi:MAG: hypothetical protein ABFE07_28495 [Armatimonadia bacterium]
MKDEELLMEVAKAIRTEAVGVDGDKEGPVAWLPEARAALWPVVLWIREAASAHGCEGGPRRGCDQDCSDCAQRDLLESLAKDLSLLAAPERLAPLGTGWVCLGCGREWSAMLGDAEVPEICPSCGGDVEEGRSG